MYRVFVYGTLRSGASNAFRMRGARSLGEGTVCARLYRVHHDFPGVILSENPEEIVVGEVFTDVSKNLLHQLDLYEGCDQNMPESERVYRRTLTYVTLESGEFMEAYIWEYIREVSGADWIPSGDWL